MPSDTKAIPNGITEISATHVKIFCLKTGFSMSHLLAEKIGNAREFVYSFRNDIAEGVCRDSCLL